MSNQVNEAFFTGMVELEGTNEEAEDFLSEDENPVKNCPKSWVTFGNFLLDSARQAARNAEPQEEPPKVQPSDFGETELNFSATQPLKSMDQPMELKVEISEGFPTKRPAVSEFPESLVELEASTEGKTTSDQKQVQNLKPENIVQKIKKSNTAIKENNKRQLSVLQANLDILRKYNEKEIHCGSMRYQVRVEKKSASADRSDSARTSGGRSSIFLNLGKEHGVFVRRTGEVGPVSFQLVSDSKPLFLGPLDPGIHLSIDNSNLLRLKAPLPNGDHRIEKRPIGFSTDCIIAILVDDDSQIHLEKS